MNLVQESQIEVKVKLHSPHVNLERNGDLIDLQYCGILLDGKVVEEKVLKYYRGDVFKVSLGFSMELPGGKMGKIYPRSSTRKKFNVMLTNSVGNIDNDYNSDEDLLMAEFLAIENGEMKLGDRILQFEITDVMPKVVFNVVESLDNDSRGGYGSTGH